MSNKENARAVVRMSKGLKHYKNNILTQAGEADADTVDKFLVDLHVYAAAKGIDLVDRMNEAHRATYLPEAKPVERRAVARDTFGLPIPMTPNEEC